MTRNELQIIGHWKRIFDMVEQSGDFPKEWCRKNGIEYEEFRQYACIFERQKYSSSFTSYPSYIMEDIKDEEPKFEIKPFEVKPIEGTPLVEVPFTAQKSVREIVSNPWFGHTPSLVLSFRDAHFSFYGNYTEERIRTALRGVFLNA